MIHAKSHQYSVSIISEDIYLKSINPEGHFADDLFWSIILYTESSLPGLRDDN
jgi:hypothetical protein